MTTTQILFIILTKPFAILDGQMFGVDNNNLAKLMEEAGLSGLLSSAAPTTTGMASLLVTAVAAILFF